MTTKKITNYAALILIVFSLFGMMTVYASEVTGTLSSNSTSDSTVGGNINGTVSSDNSGGGSSGGGGGGGSRSSNSSSDGEVLGASTDNLSAPSFPSAGFNPEETISF